MVRTALVAPVQPVATPRSVAPSSAPPPKAAEPKPTATHPHATSFALPPVLGPVFFVPRVSSRSPAIFFAASALALAALTAASGAGLVFSWSRR